MTRATAAVGTFVALLLSIPIGIIATPLAFLATAGSIALLIDIIHGGEPQHKYKPSFLPSMPASREARRWNKLEKQEQILRLELDSADEQTAPLISNMLDEVRICKEGLLREGTNRKLSALQRSTEKVVRKELT